MKTTKTIKAVFFLCFIYFLPIDGNAQSQRYVEFGSSIGLGAINNDVLTQTKELKISALAFDYKSKFTFKLPMTVATGLFENDNSNNYENSYAVGVAGGYNFKSTEKMTWQILGEIGNTIPSSKKDAWEYFYYNASCNLILGKNTDFCNGVFAIGVQQYFSQNASVIDESLVVPYVSFGLKLRSQKRK